MVIFQVVWGQYLCICGVLLYFPVFSPTVKAHTILALRVLMQKDRKFEASLGYILKSVLMKKKKVEEEGEEDFLNLCLYLGEWFLRQGFSVY